MCVCKRVCISLIRATAAVCSARGTRHSEHGWWHTEEGTRGWQLQGKEKRNERGKEQEEERRKQ